MIHGVQCHALVLCEASCCEALVGHEKSPDTAWFAREQVETVNALWPFRSFES
jgi:hypothetical protein